MGEQSDLLILGGGIAGMTAAIYAARANLGTTILETNICGGLVNSTYVVENFPSYPSIHGMELMNRVREQVEALGVRIEEACEVLGVDLAGPSKSVATDIGEYAARAVIVGTGRRPIPLIAENVEDCEQVHYCAICDGALYQGKRVLVVGGGNSGFDEALYLMGLGVKELLLVEMMPRFFAAPQAQEKLLSLPGVSARHSTQVKSLSLVDGRLSEVVLKPTEGGLLEAVPVDGIFVFMGQSPNTELFREVLPLDEQGFIVTNENMETGLPGIYAVGDVRQKQFRQITTAMSDGTIAALGAERYLREGKTDI